MSGTDTDRLLPFRLIYHDGYDLNFGPHVFPAQKYRLIRERLLAEGFAAPGDFLVPTPASDTDLMLVHERGWIERLKNGTLSFFEIRQLEVPYSHQMAEGFFLAAGGTTLAARCALDDGVGFNVGGGFHHAFSGHGEGFCAVHDVAVAVRVLQRDRRIQRAMVVDCDVHHGNGTAAIFKGDGDVFTVSVHQFHNYPAIKPPSSIDVDLANGVGDEDYLSQLREALHRAYARFQPDILLYVAGADPYADDQLGGLSLTLDGLIERDRTVIGMALERGVPVAVTLAGGYAANLEDTVTIHANTAHVARNCVREIGWKSANPG